jgi:hypothetical protein
LQNSLYKKDVYCPHCYSRHQEKETQRINLMRENNMKALKVRQQRAKEVREKWEKSLL